MSALGHAAAVSVLLTWLPILFPGRRVIAAAVAVDISRELDYQVTMLPLLPPAGDASAISDLERLPEQIMRSATNLSAEGGRPGSNPPKPDFAGPQEIVSNIPEATNNVQTIRRPDLVAPPTLANPVRLESLVMLSAPPVPVQRAPELEQHVLPDSQELSAERSLVVAADRVVPRVTGTDTEANVPEAVVVVDAVSVPPEPVPVIPDAELPGRFVVAPWTMEARRKAPQTAQRLPRRARKRAESLLVVRMAGNWTGSARRVCCGGAQWIRVRRRNASGRDCDPRGYSGTRRASCRGT